MVLRSRMQKGISLKTGKLVSIFDVENGLKCDCVCPWCKGKLEACQGNIKAWYFRHVTSECQYGFQTSLHYQGKDVLSKCKFFIVNGKRYDIDKVYLEQSEEDYIPDITVISKGRKYYIEIYVTHKTNDFKLLKLYRDGITTFELDLSQVDRDINDELLYQIFTNSITSKYKNVVYSFECICDKEERVRLKDGMAAPFDMGNYTQCPLLKDVDGIRNQDIDTRQFCKNCKFIRKCSTIIKKEKKVYFSFKDKENWGVWNDLFKEWRILFNPEIGEDVFKDKYICCASAYMYDDCDPYLKEYIKKQTIKVIDHKRAHRFDDGMYYLKMYPDTEYANWRDVISAADSAERIIIHDRVEHHVCPICNGLITKRVGKDGTEWLQCESFPKITTPCGFRCTKNDYENLIGKSIH